MRELKSNVQDWTQLRKLQNLLKFARPSTTFIQKVAKKGYHSLENCENYKMYHKIYHNSQDHWQSLCNLFKALQGSPIQSYENCKNYKIYENCDFYDNLQDHWGRHNQRNLFKGLQEGPLKVTRIVKNCKIYVNCEIYDNLPYHWHNQQKGCRQGSSKVWACDIYENSLAHQWNRSKLFKG